jgi:putative DNA primase/helicase
MHRSFSEMNEAEWLNERQRLVAWSCAQGWQVLRLGFREKKPEGTWEANSITDPASLSGLHNVGVVLGERSGGLCDIDFDMPEAAEVASLVWPDGLTFGRKSNPRSHRLIRCPDAGKTQQLMVPESLATALRLKKTMVIELRSNGGQTVFPPSVHETDEVVGFDTVSQSVPELSWADAERLLRLNAFLAVVVARYPRTKGNRDDICMALSGTLLRAGLSVEEADKLVIGVAKLRGDEEADKRGKAAQTAAARDAGEPTTGLKRLCELLDIAEHEGVLAKWLPASGDGTLVFDPNAPMKIARHVLAELRPHLLSSAGDWYDYSAPIYRLVEPKVIERDLYALLENARAPAGRDGSPRPFNPRKKHITDVTHALAAMVNREQSALAPPCWLAEHGPDTRHLVVCRNAIVNVPTGEVFATTPNLFALNCVDFDYVPDAPEPSAWLRFLASIWRDDPASIATLQEMFGYLLTADTSHQKAFMLIGPPRSGKGTIMRLLRRLVGEANVCDPSAANLGERFGMECLIGKSLAIMNDVRIGPKANSVAIIETMLRITGEDSVTIDRKNKQAVTHRLTTRFVMTLNELPRLSDASSAFASRLVPLVMERSFLGAEDKDLDAKLATELPAILNWSLMGWRRLATHTRFIVPDSAQGAVEEMMYLGSPVKAFVSEMCTRKPTDTVEKRALYAAFCAWVQRTGEHSISASTFGSKLKAAFPDLDEDRPRSGECDGRPRRHKGIGLRPDADVGIQEPRQGQFSGVLDTPF